MSIELVVFDIAGTTVTDNGNINEVFRRAFANAGINNVDPSDVDDVMGYRKQDAIEILVAKYIPALENDKAVIDTIDAIHEDFNNQLIEYYETFEDLLPLPFAEKVFKELHNHKIKVALNTGFTRAITTPILKRLGWDTATFIDSVICSDEVSQGRPYPFMIENLRQKLNINYAEKVAKVGDTRIDIQEGHNAGCGIVVGITTGAYTKEELVKYRPDYVIHSLEILPSLIY